MDTLQRYYYEMLRIRMVEEAIATRYSEQKMRCPTHLSIGQEACAVGVSAHLTVADKAFSSHRAHAHYLAKGGSLVKLIAELYGKSTGCTGGRGGSMHLTDLACGFVASTAIVGNSIPVAVGQALHQKLQNKAQITVAYFGDGATEEGAFYEAANFAAVRQLPVLFVCENNRYSVYSDLSCRQPKGRSIVKLAEAIGLATAQTDGNDVVAVSDYAGALIENIRAGNGPALIELHTYRHREHCGPNFDDHLNYRAKQEVDEWLSKDPLQQLAMKLEQHRTWTSQYAAMQQQIQNEIDSAFNEAEAAPYPNPDNNEKYLYA